jgi:hypothetical protein
MKKLILTIAMCAMVILLNAQSIDFKQINVIGKTESQIITSIKAYSFHKGEGFIEKNRVDSWHSMDFGLIGYIYNKKNVCIAMAIPVNSQRSFEISKNYTVRTVNNMFIVTISK